MTIYRRPLKNDLARARQELMLNPTISVYTFRGGIEKRRRANPWASARVALDRLQQSMEAAAASFAEFERQLRKSFGGRR